MKKALIFFIVLLSVIFSNAQNTFNYSTDAMGLFTQLDRDSIDSKLLRINTVLETNINGHIKASYPYLAYANGRIAYLKSMEDDLKTMVTVPSSIALAIAYDYEGSSTFADVSISLPKQGILASAHDGVIAMIEEDFISTFKAGYKSDFLNLKYAFNLALDKLYTSLSSYSNGEYGLSPTTEAELKNLGFVKFRTPAGSISYSHDASKKYTKSYIQDHIGLSITSAQLNVSDKLLREHFGSGLTTSGVTYISSKSTSTGGGSSFKSAFDSEKKAPNLSFWIHLLDGVAYMRVGSKMSLSDAYALQKSYLQENMRNGELFTSTQVVKPIRSKGKPCKSENFVDLLPADSTQFLSWNLKDNIMPCYPSGTITSADLPIGFSILAGYSDFQLKYSAGVCYAVADGMLGYVKIAMHATNIFSFDFFNQFSEKVAKQIENAAKEDIIGESELGEKVLEVLATLIIGGTLGPVTAVGLWMSGYLKPLLVLLRKGVEFVYNIVVSMIKETVELISNLFFADGIKSAGYSMGTLMFEVASDLITSGAGKMLKNGLKHFFDALPNTTSKMLKRGKSNPRCILKAGKSCFVRNTPVHVNTLRNVAVGSALATAPILTTTPIQDVKLFDYVSTHKTINSKEVITASLENSYPFLQQDVHTSDQQRQRDKYQLDTKNWNEVVFEQLQGKSRAKLALHSDWIKKQGYKEHSIVNMQLPEQGISGPFRITSIKHIIPQKKPADNDESDDYDCRPVTGLFQHVSDQVYTLIFDNGEYLGVTYNHPIYSTTANNWRAAGELEIGEEVLTKKGPTKVLKSTKQDNTQPVYNLEVKDYHNYLVATSGIVVHNSYSAADIDNFITKYGNKEINGIPDPKIRGALTELKALKDFDNKTYQKFLNDFKDKPPHLDLGAGGVKAWKKADNLLEAGDDAFKNAFKNLKKDPDFLKKFDNVINDVDLNDHVFKGHIKKKTRQDGTEYWEAGGVHSKKAIDDGHAAFRTTPESIGPDGAGYYTVKVKVYDPSFPQNGGWKSKTKPSTFFPDSWSKERIQAETARVLNNNPSILQTKADGSKLLGGVMSDGVDLRIWQNADGSLISAFPKFN